MAESTISLFGRILGYVRIEQVGALSEQQNEFKCVGAKLLGFRIHFHYGKLIAGGIGEETWPKFRLRIVEIFGRRMPLLYWPL